jgi:Icc-related predicted phosphoesterase
MTKRETIRVAAAGDIHCSEQNRAAVADAFAGIAGQVDAILVAGDLTTFGEPEQAEVLADACGGLEIPVVTVLGNHDWHANRADEIVNVLSASGIVVLDRSWTVLDCGRAKVGVVGTKGFVGGFPDSTLTDFGEPIMRAVYAETTDEVEALDRGLEAVADCPVRIVLLHYAPTSSVVSA